MGPASAGPHGCLSWHGYLCKILTCVFDYCRPLGGMRTVVVVRFLLPSLDLREAMGCLIESASGGACVVKREE